MSQDTVNGIRWEVFVQPRRGLAHQHVGSVHGGDHEAALAHARDLYARRGEATSLWVVRVDAVHTYSAAQRDVLTSNAVGKPYRYPDHYVPLEDDEPADTSSDEPGDGGSDEH